MMSFIHKKFIVIFGPEAVGKATVGRELARLLDYKLLLHEDINYMVRKTLGTSSINTIERVVAAFGKGFSRADIKGIVYARAWNFALASDSLSVSQLIKFTCTLSANIYYVELAASKETRLMRNTLSDRLQNKPILQNINYANEYFEKKEKSGRYYSDESEFRNKNYIRIETDNLSAGEVAYIILDKFKLLN